MNERLALTAAVQTAVELFLASVGFMPAGPRLLSYRVLRVCFSSAARRQKRRKGWGGSPIARSVAASYASAGQARR